MVESDLKLKVATAIRDTYTIMRRQYQPKFNPSTTPFSVWEKVASVVAREKADPIEFVTAQFFETGERSMPYPGMLCGDHAIAHWQRVVESGAMKPKSRWSYARDYGIYSKIDRRLDPNIVMGMIEPHVAPLLLWVVAYLSGLDAGKYREAAKQQFETDPEYVVCLKDLIPEGAFHDVTAGARPA